MREQKRKQNLSRGQREYFKDTLMKDKNGDLQVFYHGTTHNFDTFARNHREGNIGDNESGFFFTAYKREADYYGVNKGGQTLEVYLDIKNPLTLETKEDYALMNKYMAECFPGVNWQQEHICTDKFKNYLKDKGHDGVVTGGMIIVYEPNQIKAVDNLYPTHSDNFKDNSKEYLQQHLKDLSVDEACAIAKHIKQAEIQARTKPARENDRSDNYEI